MINSVFAADYNITIAPPTNLKTVDLGNMISGAIGAVLVIAILAAFVYLVWGGIEWITSGGDKTHTESARNRIQNAILGLFIVFAAWAVMKIIGGFFGIDFPTINIPKGYL